MFDFRWEFTLGGLLARSLLIPLTWRTWRAPKFKIVRQMSQYTPFAGTSGNRATATLPNSPGKNTKDQGEPKRRQQLLFVNLLFWVWFKKWGPKSEATILVLFFAGTTAQFTQRIYKFPIFWRCFRMDMTPFCHPVEAAWEWHGNQLKDVPKKYQGAGCSIRVRVCRVGITGAQWTAPVSFIISSITPQLGHCSAIFTGNCRAQGQIDWDATGCFWFQDWYFEHL